MKNPPFTYHRPESLDDALALLAEHVDEAKVLAGGQSLLPVMALRLGRPEHLVDINRIPGLDQIAVSDDGVSIGALVRHVQAERSDELATAAPVVHAAMPYIGHRAIRSQGTVCGSIAHADPAAEMPAVCLATGATMVATSADGVREIPAAEFGEGYLTTALAPTEILTEVRFPAWSATAAGTVVEVARRHGDYALVGLACVVDAPGGTIESAALSFFGVDNRPVRIAEAEASLVGKSLDDMAAFAAAGDIVKSTIEPSADVHATANYRKHLASVLTRKGLAEATSKIGAAA
ncbi:MAG: xanthine dehydrogenase family protein subunit M [Actinomycetota bacterium]